MAKAKLEEWINIPSVMETRHGTVEGTIKYGIRLPIKPATTPLMECELGSRDKVSGEKAKYYFVNDEEALKIRLITKSVSDNAITGLAYDNTFFRYIIKKK